MIPIFEQGHQQGIGHGYNSFLKRFIDICENHLKNKRAKSFAFILYDFHDKQIRDILKSQGGFAKLDRLSGSELSVFYIHSDNKKLVKAFNRIFVGAFEIKNTAELPCVLFFKMEDGDVDDVQIVELEQTDKMFAFQELYNTIENYLKNSKNLPTPKRNKLTEFIGKVKTITVEELIKWVIGQGLERAEDIY
ncbi:hypothetical protein H0I25_14005 [Cellulophaga sp. HaHa_2_95]|uniref:hypothetical protein n=1 Tax=Cellulophaga sp. HaHa_2_95 TaxID=2745558 RepID=UPI001C4E5A6E|nr:hypothetical protein [Cellulophaga sp. HaHa_2_95]QXP55186.1 hypothetical protein H0I25_14005 [Cellulophaga sp. HaHa_2_95]